MRNNFTSIVDWFTLTILILRLIGTNLGEKHWAMTAEVLTPGPKVGVPNTAGFNAVNNAMWKKRLDDNIDVINNCSQVLFSESSNIKSVGNQHSKREWGILGPRCASGKGIKPELKSYEQYFCICMLSDSEKS